MSSPLRNRLIALIVLFQVLILAGMFIKAFYPLWWGTSYRFRVIPYDPRDLLRGNYVDLRYDFNEINLDSLPNNLGDPSRYHFGDVFYLELLHSAADNIYVPAGLWLEAPTGKPFMRVLCNNHYYGNHISIQAGIESYFANPQKAIDIERAMINRSDSLHVYVNISIAPNGQARIRDIDYTVMD